MVSLGQDEYNVVVIFETPLDGTGRLHFKPVIARNVDEANDAIREIADEQSPGQTIEAVEEDKLRFNGVCDGNCTFVEATIYRDLKKYKRH